MRQAERSTLRIHCSPTSYFPLQDSSSEASESLSTGRRASSTQVTGIQVSHHRGRPAEPKMSVAPRLLSSLRASLRSAQPLRGPHISAARSAPVAGSVRSAGSRRFASSFGSSPLPSTASSSGTGGSRFRSQLAKPTTIVLIFVPILCGFLGVWQVKRLRWKVALIDEVERNLHKEPMVLPGNIKYVYCPHTHHRM